MDNDAHIGLDEERSLKSEGSDTEAKSCSDSCL